MKKSLKNSILIKLFVVNFLILADNSFASNRANGVAPAQQIKNNEADQKLLSEFANFEAQNKIIVDPKASRFDKAIAYSRATKLYSQEILKRYDALERLVKAKPDLDKMSASQPLKDFFERAKYYLSEALTEKYEIEEENLNSLKAGKQVKVTDQDYQRLVDVIEDAKSSIKSAYNTIHFFLREYKK